LKNLVIEGKSILAQQKLRTCERIIFNWNTRETAKITLPFDRIYCQVRLYYLWTSCGENKKTNFVEVQTEHNACVNSKKQNLKLRFSALLAQWRQKTPCRTFCVLRNDSRWRV